MSVLVAAGRLSNCYLAEHTCLHCSRSTTGSSQPLKSKRGPAIQPGKAKRVRLPACLAEIRVSRFHRIQGLPLINKVHFHKHSGKG